MIRLETLSLPAPAFARYTYPRFRPLLTGEETSPTVQAIGAFLNDIPVGLALLHHDFKELNHADRNQTRLSSIMVARPCRRGGIGRALIRSAMDAAHRFGSNSLIAFHSNSTQNREDFEAFLTATGWEPPELSEFRLAGHADWTERSAPVFQPMLRRLATQGYSAAPWESVTAEDREQANSLIPEERVFDYRIYEPHCDKKVSIVLRQHGKLVGWVFGENQKDTGYYHYTNGYVAPALQSKGWLVAGIYVMCRYQAAAYGATSVAVYETLGENARMIGFMKRRLVPVGPLWVDERYASRYQLR